MEENQEFQIKKSAVILTIIFNFLTGGIYSCAWFLIRRKDFNRISKSKKLGMTIPIICLFLFTLNWMFSFANGVIAGINESSPNDNLIILAHKIEMGCKALAYGGSFLLLVPSFRAKAMLEEYLKKKDRFALSLSGAATFFFFIYYLQYRVNKIHKEISNQNLEPIVTTPVDEVEVQSTQAHV